MVKQIEALFNEQRTFSHYVLTILYVTVVTNVAIRDKIRINYPIVPVKVIMPCHKLHELTPLKSIAFKNAKTS